MASLLKRLFIGISIPDELKEALHERVPLDNRPNKIKWTPVENLHLTTCFIGETDKIDFIKNQLISLEEMFPPFELKLQSIHKAPPKKPYMVWASFEKNDHYVKLARTTFQYLFPEEEQKKEPIPHITIARYKFLKEEQFLENFQDMKGYTFHVDRFHLWESVLKPHGPEYYQLSTYLLKDNP